MLHDKEKHQKVYPGLMYLNNGSYPLKGVKAEYKACIPIALQGYLIPNKETKDPLRKCPLFLVGSSQIP